MSNLQCLITSLHILLIVFLFFFVKQRLLIKVMKLGRPAWHFTSGFSNFVFSLIRLARGQFSLIGLVLVGSFVWCLWAWTLGLPTIELFRSAPIAKHVPVFFGYLV